MTNHGGTMKKIGSLTAEHEARFQEWVDRWVAVGLSTEPTDFERAEEAVRHCYRVAKLDAPRVILRMASPYAATVGGTLAVMRLKDASARREEKPAQRQVQRYVQDAVWRQIQSQVSSQVRGQIERQIVKPVNDRILSQLQHQICDQVYGPIGGPLQSQSRHQISRSVQRQIVSAWAQYRGCQLWVAWYAYVTFLRDVCGWEDESLTAFAFDEQLARSAGWTWWSEEVCAISDRPCAIARNERGQLHCTTGPALEYRDGWGVWAYHGVRVTEQIVMNPETLTKEQIASERNAQVRQVMVERIGIERVCQMFHAKVLDMQGTYQLLDLDLGDGLRRPYLKMLNPSIGVWHVEGVPPQCATVQQAINWRAGHDHEEWQPDVLT